MKKLIAVILSVLMLFSLITVGVSAQEPAGSSLTAEDYAALYDSVDEIGKTLRSIGGKEQSVNAFVDFFKNLIRAFSAFFRIFNPGTQSIDVSRQSDLDFVRPGDTIRLTANIIGDLTVTTQANIDFNGYTIAGNLTYNLPDYPGTIIIGTPRENDRAVVTGTLTIDAPKTSFEVYGVYGNTIVINAVALDSFHFYGTAASGIIIKEGRLVIEDSGKTESVELAENSTDKIILEIKGETNSLNHKAPVEVRIVVSGTVVEDFTLNTAGATDIIVEETGRIGKIENVFVYEGNSGNVAIENNGVIDIIAHDVGETDIIIDGERVIFPIGEIAGLPENFVITQQAKLSYKVSNSPTIEWTERWVSGDESILTVSQDGTITGVAPGTTTLSLCVIAPYSDIIETIDVTVGDALVVYPEQCAADNIYAKFTEAKAAGLKGVILKEGTYTTATTITIDTTMSVIGEGEVIIQKAASYSKSNQHVINVNGAVANDRIFVYMFNLDIRGAGKAITSQPQSGKVGYTSGIQAIRKTNLYVYDCDISGCSSGALSINGGNGETAYIYADGINTYDNSVGASMLARTTSGVDYYAYFYYKNWTDDNEYDIETGGNVEADYARCVYGEWVD